MENDRCWLSDELVEMFADVAKILGIPKDFTRKSLVDPETPYEEEIEKMIDSLESPREIRGYALAARIVGAIAIKFSVEAEKIMKEKIND